MSNNDAINIMKNSDLNEKSDHYKKFYYIYIYKNERNNLLSKKQRNSTK